MAKQHSMKKEDYEQSVCAKHGNEFAREGTCVRGAHVCDKCHGQCPECDYPYWLYDSHPA